MKKIRDSLEKLVDPSLDLKFDLTDLVDIHIHSAPDVQPRYGDDIELAYQAKEAGMQAILFKSHVTLTSDRAQIAEKVVGGIRVFGGLALNQSIGGLNPAAVKVGVEMGARVVWMPTRSAAHVLKQEGMLGGITILDGAGNLRAEVHEIIDIIKQADIVLATGHLSPQESFLLVKQALSRGLRRIVVTHPESHLIRMPLEMQREIANEGVYFEHCYVDTTPEEKSLVSVAEIAAKIHEIGISHIVLSTDFGQAISPAPVEGLSAFLYNLSQLGFSKDDLYRMAGENPAYLLGIS